MYLVTPDTSLECVAAIAAICLKVAHSEPGDGNAAEVAETTERLIQALNAKTRELRDQGANQSEIRIMQRLSGAVEEAAELAAQKVIGTSRANAATCQSRRALV